MKKLIIFCLTFVLSTSVLANNSDSFTSNYSILEPPKEVKFDVEQAKHFFNVAGGCLYIYMVQHKQATMASLLEQSPAAEDWRRTTEIEARNWLKTGIFLENILVNHFNFQPESIRAYKIDQMQKLNSIYMQMFMELDTAEYFMRLLNGTGFCEINKPALFEFIELASKANKEKFPQADKPKRRM